GGELLLWNVASGTVRQSLKGNRWAIQDLALTRDGKMLVTVGGNDWGFSGDVKLWDARSGEELASLPGHHDPVCRVALAADGSTLATAGRDGGIHLWDIADVRDTR